jgi:hypothetical protein
MVEDKETFKSLIPSNDIILRFLRIIRVFASRMKPSDRNLPERLLHEAYKAESALSDLEIALLASVNIETAKDIGTMLVAKIGGEIVVSELGDLVFLFKKEKLAAFATMPEVAKKSDLEFFKKENNQQFSPKANGALLNLAGISHKSYLSLFRLAGGAFLLSAVAVIIIAFGLETDQPKKFVEYLIIFGVPLFPSGVFVLISVFSYAMRFSVNNGVYRDIQRMTIACLKSRYESGEKYFSVSDWEKQITPLLQKVWKNIEIAHIQKVMTNACNQLGLKLAMDQMGQPGNQGAVIFELESLTKRFAALAQVKQSEKLYSDDAPDEIVFESSEENH